MDISRAGSDSLQPNIYNHYEARVRGHCLKFTDKKRLPFTTYLVGVGPFLPNLVIAPSFQGQYH